MAGAVASSFLPRIKLIVCQRILIIDEMSFQRRIKVLVLDGDMVPALTIARSLFRLGYQVDIGSPVDRSLTSYSRTVSRTLTYPDPLQNSGDFVQWLVDLTTVENYALVVPVTERSLVPIKNAGQQFPRSLIAMADAASIDAVLDKAKTFELAESLNIPVPRGIELSSEDDLKSLEWDQFPAVIKPAASVASKGAMSKQLTVDYAFDRHQLKAKLKHFLSYGRVILQHRVAGAGIGVEVLAHHGKIIYAFQHQRLHEVPLTGGGSTLRKSVPLDSELLDASTKLIEKLNWHGVAMVEFKMDLESREFYLMEINGRFWGSLPLAAAAGADFPGMLVQMLLDGRVDFPQEYKQGIICRRLSGDIRWYEMALRREAPSELGVLPSKKAMINEFLMLFSFKHRFDVQNLSDPFPGFVDVWNIINDYWSRFSGIIKDKWFNSKQRFAWSHGQVERAYKESSNVLFLCYGNINRSAIAELLARRARLDRDKVITSAGFHHIEGRDMDPVMSSIAAENDVMSAGFGSSLVSLEMVENADIIFVMEKRHFDDLMTLYPDTKMRIFLLGGAVMDPADGMMLPDPYGKHDNVYRSTYSRINECVEVLKGWSQ